MNVFERTLLAGIVRTIDRWKLATIKFPNDSRADHDRYHAEAELQKLAEDEITPIDLGAFLGDSATNSDRVRASRAYAALEALGFVQRLTARHSSRTVAIQVTAAGREAVDSLSALRDSPTATPPCAKTAEAEAERTQDARHPPTR